MQVPTVNPIERDQVPGADNYRNGDRVWVHRHGSWHPGTVRDASHLAVLVSYHRSGERGLLTDTVPDVYVMNRDEPDPELDGKRAML